MQFSVLSKNPKLIDNAVLSGFKLFEYISLFRFSDA